MKVSKVDHKRTCVTIKKDENIEGMLYENPKKDLNIDLKQYIEEKSRKERSLYSVCISGVAHIEREIESCKDRDNLKKLYNRKTACKNLISAFNNFMHCFLKKNKYDTGTSKVVNSQINFLKKKRGDILIRSGRDFIKIKKLRIDTKGFEKEDLITEILLYCVRKSLRKTVSKDSVTVSIIEVLREFFEIICSGNKCDEKIKTMLLHEDKIRIFFEVLNEDYLKTKQIKNIVTSIENQNVRVQVDNREGDNKGKLILSKALKGSKKTEKKEYKKDTVFEFLKLYSDSDAVEKSERREYLKRLVTLYYYNVDIQEKNFIFEKYWKEEDRENSVFSDELHDLLKQKNTLDISQDKSAKNKKKQIDNEINQEIRKALMEHYNNCMDKALLSNEDIQWIGIISDFASKIIGKSERLIHCKIELRYLAKHTYKELLKYIAGKYIDIGKAVYHFTNTDVFNATDNKVKIGEVLPEYSAGITSFDYEEIKAKESLERDLCVFISFALNNFSHAVIKDEFREIEGNEDILTCKNLQDGIYENAVKKILQFFGGISSWKNDIEICGDKNKERLVDNFKILFSTLRNRTFHYTTTIKEIKNDDLLISIFDKEYGRLGNLICKKYYSNNVWMFYKKDNIHNMVADLYVNVKNNKAHIPSFNKIIHRKDMDEILKKMNIKNLSKISSDTELYNIYSSSLYFILKEIYYYDFLQNSEKDLRNLFDAAFKNEKEKAEAIRDKKDSTKFAMRNFQKRIIELGRNCSFSNLCQDIMTEYNLQNENYKVESSSDKTEKIYKHYKAILYLCIREAYLNYLSENLEKYLFLQEINISKTNSTISEAEFCADFSLNAFSGIKKDIENNSFYMSWYMMAHFLNKKQLNLLIGSIKSYIQFLEDIHKRKKAAGLTSKIKYKKQNAIENECNEYKKILEVLELSFIYNGMISNIIDDYFEEGEYEKYLSDFIAFEGDKYLTDNEKLKQFCLTEISESPFGKTGIFYNEKKPVLNRNVVNAKIYGKEKIFKNTLKPISQEEIKNLYSLKDEVLKEKDLKKKEEKNREYQQLKNRIELTDVIIYMELLNDFTSQMISWTYIRERDIMYFQLGFHYIKLFYGNKRVASWMDSISLQKEKIDIEKGALLYQLIAVYTYGLPLYDKTGNVICKPGVLTSGCIRAFYSKYCEDKGEIFDEGLELIQSPEDEKKIISLRNFVDHNKYYSNAKKSILEQYMEMHDVYLAYNTNFHKSVSFIFKNILQKYFVKSYFSITPVEIKSDIHSEKVTDTKLNLDLNLKTDKFIVKLENEKKIKVNVRSEIFLQQLKQILQYKE